MTDFTAIISAWPNASELARDIGVEPNLVRQWRARNSIPGRYWVAVEAAAQGRGIPGVSVAVLAAMAQTPTTKADAAPEGQAA